MTERDKEILKAAQTDITPEEEILADRLHSLICHLTHDYRCNYFYSNWEDPNYIRCYYLLKARALLALCQNDVNLAVAFIDTIFSTP